MKKIFINPPLRHQRAYGVFVYGAHNISLLSEYFDGNSVDKDFDLYHVLLTKRDEIAKDALMICDRDEFDRISCDNFGDWQSKKWLKDEMETQISAIKANTTLTDTDKKAAIRDLKNSYHARFKEEIDSLKQSGMT
jgi:hypothetical protein